VNTRGNVFLVDDDEALRRATARLLDACGFSVRAFGSAEAFLASFDPKCSGCLLLDLRMPGVSGLELQTMLQQRAAALPIVFLTGHGDVSASVRAMKRGAVDFLEKPVCDEELTAALDRAIARDVAARRDEVGQSNLALRHASLTVREREVLVEIVAGKLNKQVAFSLGIAERTVKLHRSRVLEKMGAKSLADLVRMAEKLGIGPNPPKEM
jgi:FixJ family two-component response regulator